MVKMTTTPKDPCPTCGHNEPTFHIDRALSTAPLTGYLARRAKEDARRIAALKQTIRDWRR